MKLSEMMRAQPILRGALIAPSVVVLIFVFFNLTAVVDQAEVIQKLDLGVVNLDEGVPLPGAGPLRVADQALAAMERQLPVGLVKLPNETVAMRALDQGEVVAVLVFPPDFTRSIAGGGTVSARVINSDHLSVLETQFGRTLPAQLQAALSLIVLGARTQMPAVRAAPPPAAAAPPPGAVPAVPVPPVAVAPLDAPPPGPQPAPPPGMPVPPTATAASLLPPPVMVTVTTLHQASHPLLLQAPFVLTFASFLGALIGAILLFIGTRPMLAAGYTGPVLQARTLIPLLAAVLAALVAVVTIAALTGAWANFWELWAFRWLASAAALAVMTALFSLFGWFAFVVAVPLVFYQSLVAGLVAPAAAAPWWIGWLGYLPFRQMSEGLRTLLIGGPPGSVPWASVGWMLAGSIAATWIGTLLWARRRRVPSVA